MRSNTHQAQLRQKFKYDRTIRAKAYKQGDLLWVFCCRYVPQKGSPNLMAWPTSRGSHGTRRARLHSRHSTNVQFERLKPHNSDPTEIAATPFDTGDIAVTMDPEPERRRHWMNTRLRTKLCAGGSRQHCQQFDYSTSETVDESSGAMLPIPLQSPKSEHPLLPREPIKDLTLSDPQSEVSLLDCPPQLFSDHELARLRSPQLSRSPSPSAQFLVGTSAPLLTHHSLIDYLSSYPIWPNRAEDSSLTPSRPASP